MLEVAATFNLKDVITEALTALGGSATPPEVREYIKSKYGKDWKNIQTIMDDLSVDSPSSFFPQEERVLKRMGQGRYSLKEAATSEPAATEKTIREPKPESPSTIQSALEEAIAFYSEKIRQILNEPKFTFGETAENQIPTGQGIYLIYDDKSTQVVYTERSENLRTDLIRHKEGTIENSVFRQLLAQKYNLNSEFEISEYVATSCKFQFMSIDSLEANTRLHHFILAILTPTLNNEPESRQGKNR